MADLLESSPAIEKITGGHLFHKKLKKKRSCPINCFVWIRGRGGGGDRKKRDLEARFYSWPHYFPDKECIKIAVLRIRIRDPVPS